uniref:Ankyrin repeat domain 6b n=1 Tax=Monopterus albus TaxID=43700 RepID=A0A3Q3JJM6_MONAL
MSQQDAAEVLALSERLLIASHKGQADNVVQLINKGAKVAVTKYGRSPLHLAAYKGHIEVVRILLKAGCDLDIQDDGKQTALHRAAVVGNSDIISALIQEGCALDRQDKDGNTSLHEVSWHGFSQCVKLLVKAGANVHAKNKAGNTALHLACQNGHAQSSKFLLLGGSRPDSKNHGGDTCLHVAARYNHVAVVCILLGAFCSVSEKNLVTALNHKKTVRLLLEAGADSRTCNNAGETALDQAREHNNPDVALLLTKAPQCASVTHRGNWRDKLKAEGRAQSVPREEMLPFKDNASAADDTQSSDRALLLLLQLFLSDPLHRRRETRHSESFQKRKDKLQGASPYASIPPHNFKAYQLYTLYRGKDGKIMQAPLNGCRCEPLISKLENQLEATKEEMKTEIHTVQDLMNTKMGQLERKNKHQIWALDKMTVERVSAERTECLQRIEQRVLQERQEAEKREQASLVSELKCWCLSKLHSMEVRYTGDPGSTKLQRSSSVAEGLNEADGAGPTMLPAGQRAGTQGLELDSSPAVQDCSCGEPSLAEGGSANHYFVVHVDSSPALRSLPSVQVVRPKERSALCADTQRKNEDLSDKHSEGRTKSGGATGIRPLEVIGDLPSEPTFTQERDNMHALEVTQYFFEAVSMQMERWYERKVQEAHWQADQRAQADRAALIERIAYLEDELRMLRTHRDDDC